MVCLGSIAGLLGRGGSLVGELAAEKIGWSGLDAAQPERLHRRAFGCLFTCDLGFLSARFLLVEDDLIGTDLLVAHITPLVPKEFCPGGCEVAVLAGLGPAGSEFQGAFVAGDSVLILAKEDEAIAAVVVGYRGIETGKDGLGLLELTSTVKRCALPHRVSKTLSRGEEVPFIEKPPPLLVGCEPKCGPG